ncbi:DofB protein [Hyalangium gracile]|uniref:DofB protein n=1 Tax=Hyalangium gracile TaxID=394092 RepID=UPI001CCD7C0B|nr:DofB protein [Hyalangium gracile]
MSAAIPGPKSDIIDRIFFVRYVRPPSKEDVKTVLERVAVAHKRLNQPLIYVGSIDSKTKVPNSEERNNLNELLLALREYCEVVHLIIEGSELQNSLQRVIISGMLIITRTYDNYMSVHKNISGASFDITRRLNKDPTALIQVARDRGLVI